MRNGTTAKPDHGRWSNSVLLVSFTVDWEKSTTLSFLRKKAERKGSAEPTLAEIIPGLPPKGTVGIVDPLILASDEVRSLLLIRRCRCVCRTAHPSPDEWNALGYEMLQRGVVVEISRDEAPHASCVLPFIVDAQRLMA